MSNPANNLSGTIQGGQTLQLRAGTGIINPGDLVETGGPGNLLWSVSTIDRAAAPGGSSTIPVAVVAGAVNNYIHWPSAADSSGNIYVLSPNASSQGVNATKYSPLGNVLISNAVIDATGAAFSRMRLLSLSNGTFVALYVNGATGAISFAIFDASLNVIVSPIAVATGYSVGSVSYIDGCAFSTGGFAVVYQNSAHTAITLQTYSNPGAAVLGATSIQALGGSAALADLKIAQLNSGNLVVVMRTTATPAGTSFVIVSTGGASVATNTVIDATATAGFCELNVLPGFFAISDMNGTNVKASVWSDAGAQQGGTYTGASTLNNTTYGQSKLANDGISFYLFFTLTAGGLEIVQLTTAGASSVVSTSGLASSLFTSTASLDVSISNGIAFAIGASITTGGQSYITIGLPNAALSINLPYLLSGPTALGSAAGTTGAYWPSCRALGDFTAAVIYDQQTVAGLFFSMVKFASSVIQGVAQTLNASGNPGVLVTVNPGPGSYPITQIPGTSGTLFNQIPDGGAAGTVYSAGVTLGGGNAATGAIVPSALNPISGTFGSGRIAVFSATVAAWPLPASSIRVRAWGAAGAPSGSNGGSGGGFTMKVITGLVVGSALALTVGTAGAASTVGSYCSAGGAGAASSGGDVNYAGGSGSAGGGGGGGAANLFGPGGASGKSGPSGGGGNSGIVGASGGAGITGTPGTGEIVGGAVATPAQGVAIISIDYIGTGCGGGGGANSGGATPLGGAGVNGGGGGASANGGFPGGGAGINSPVTAFSANGLIIIEW